MTVNQALPQMELVGHDFYLFLDARCGQPSVVLARVVPDEPVPDRGAQHGRREPVALGHSGGR
jgi:hypothetical protein